MHEYLFILALFMSAAYGAELQYHACPLAWPEDRQCFRQQTVYFEPGSSVVTGQAKGQVAEVAKYLAAHPCTAVLIGGHCDHRGSKEHNRWLGERRAGAVAKELVLFGVAAGRIDTVSYGEDRPADAGHDAKARKKNRRAEFVLLRPPAPEDRAVHSTALQPTTVGAGSVIESMQAVQRFRSGAAVADARRVGQE